MKIRLLVMLVAAGTAWSGASALAGEASEPIGQPSIFWHNGEWQTYKNGVWTPYTRSANPSETGSGANRPETAVGGAKPSPDNSQGAAASSGAIGERNVQMGQPTIGIGRNNTGLSQNPIGIGGNNTGIGPNNMGIGQNNTGIGRTTIGIGQNNGGIGQTTIGIGKPTIGIGERNGMGETTIGIGKQTEFQKRKQDGRPRKEKDDR